MTTLAAAAVFLAWKRITSRSDKIFVVGYALLNALKRLTTVCCIGFAGASPHSQGCASTAAGVGRLAGSLSRRLLTHAIAPFDTELQQSCSKLSLLLHT